MQQFFRLNGTLIRRIATTCTAKRMNADFSTSSTVSEIEIPTHQLVSDKAIVRTLKDMDRIEIKLVIVDPRRGLDRPFNLNRPLNENLGNLIEKIANNIEKVTLKFMKRLKKKSEAVGDEMKLDIKMVQGSRILDPEITCQEFIKLPDAGIVVGNCVYRLDVDPPAVKTLKLPSSIMAGFPVYPSKLEVENCESNKCELFWFRNCNSKDEPTNVEAWIQVGSGFCYQTTNSDIGSKLKLDCVPQMDRRKGFKESITSSQEVGAGPGLCPFEVRQEFTKKRMDHSGFRVVTYNILADLYADSDYTRTVLHPYCPPYALALDYRKQLILKELMGYNADIICLQEVDQKVFDWDLEPTLSSVKYGGVFHKKGGQVSEGLSCFFHTDKFEFIEAHSYVLAEHLPTHPLLVDLWNATQRNTDLTKRVLDRTTTLQLVVIQERNDPGRRLVVANTHLYFHPDADQIRLLQAAMGLRLAEDLRQQHSSAGSSMEATLVFCGDFNSCPGYGVYELMTQQYISEDYDAWSSNPKEAVVGLSVHNPTAMESACGTPEFTNYTTGFHGCLDYIFYQKSKLEVDQVVPLPSLEEVMQHGALPSIVFPSDHIALIADLKWRP